MAPAKRTPVEDHMDYMKNGGMRLNESLLWVLGQSRRWSSKKRNWAVNARPIKSTQYQRQLGAPDNSNIITKSYRPKANTYVQKHMPAAQLYQDGVASTRRAASNPTPRPARQPTQREQKALDKRVWEEAYARQRIVKGVREAHIEDKGFPVPSRGYPAWEEIDGPYIEESQGHDGLIVRDDFYGSALLRMTPSDEDTSSQLELRLADHYIFSWPDVRRLLINYRDYDQGRSRATQWEGRDLQTRIPVERRRIIVAFGLFIARRLMADAPYVAAFTIDCLFPVWRRLRRRNIEMAGGIEEGADGRDIPDWVIGRQLEHDLSQLPPLQPISEEAMQEFRVQWYQQLLRDGQLSDEEPELSEDEPDLPAEERELSEEGPDVSEGSQ